MFLFIEEAGSVGIVTLLLLDVHAHGDEEAEETNEGEDESHDLPEGVVTSVADDAALVVSLDVSGEVPHHEGPEAPGDEVLDGEAPPSDENVVPPLVSTSIVLVVTGGDLDTEFVSSVEEDLLAPSLGGEVLRLDGVRDDPGDDHENPEDKDSVGLEAVGGLTFSSLKGEDGNGSHNDSSDPVDDGDDHSGVLSGVSENVLGLEELSSSGTLSHSEDEHEVDGNVSVDDIEVGESPRGAEKEGSEPSENANDEGGELSGDQLATFSVVDDSGDGLNKGEGGVNSESEQGQTENEGPEVGEGEGLSSSGVGGEGKSGGGVVLGDGRSDPLEVSNDGEDSETSKEGKEAVTEGDHEDISDNRLVSSVVRGVRSHDSHADTEREENLSNGIGPHLSITELLSGISGDTINLSLKVHADTFISVREAEAVHNHDENEDAGSGNGEPNDVRGGLNTLENAEVGDHPGSQKSEHDFPGEASRLVFVTGNGLLSVVLGALASRLIDEGTEEILEEPSIIELKSWVSKFEFILGQH
jgi:hypothetical protein